MEISDMEKGRAIWIWFHTLQLCWLKISGSQTKGVVMLTTRLLQTNPSTQADLKFKAYLNWELLLKMSSVLRIMACKSSAYFSPNQFVFYRGKLKEGNLKFWPGMYTETRWPTGTGLVFVVGYWMKKTSLCKMTINFPNGLCEIFKGWR